MFKSASFRLTMWYLAILMAVSATFSLALYATSTREFDRGLKKQPYATYDYSQPISGGGFETYRQARVNELERQLAADLIIFNVVVLALGGAASYLLARRTMQPIEDAMEAQSRFTADASHELRTPLTSMRSEIEVALRAKKLSPADARGLLASNLEEVTKLEALSNSLLRLAQFSGGQTPSWQQVALVDVAKAATERLSKQAALRKINLVMEMPDLSIDGDEASLVELVVVLVDNAIKYGKAESNVRITAASRGHNVVLHVVDQGVGIAARDLPHIFDRFYRADTSRSKLTADGYGLGLSIAKQIVDIHNGRIRATSTPGNGTTMTVTLPRVQAKKA